MKRKIITVIATLAVIAATLCMAFTMTACNKATSYKFTVTYENGTPVNGQTDGTAGVSEKEVQIQICAVTPGNDLGAGFCTSPVAIGTDGKIEITEEHFAGNTLQAGQKWHVQINGADNYTYEDLYLDGYGEYTIVLVAKN